MWIGVSAGVQRIWHRSMELITGHRICHVIRKDIMALLWEKVLIPWGISIGGELEAKGRGLDFIKIMTTGILDFNNHGSITGMSLEEDEVREMVHIAHEEGMKVMSHTNGVYGVRAALKAGVDSLEHGNYMDGETLEMLAESSTCSGAYPCDSDKFAGFRTI